MNLKNKIITSIGIIVILIVSCVTSSCASTKTTHIKDIYKHKRLDLYNDCYTFANN